ncbi:MAG: transcriptional repressor [Candidatus Korarchaeota archaeon]|nr:transcriptional repressor [Candidatus Korarchaeota archaeon]
MGWSERALEALRAGGGKLTPQRLRIVSVIEELGPGHPTLKEVLSRVREDFPMVSFSTLYSNVMLLRRAGLLHVFCHGGEARIEINTSPHINVVEDGEIFDVVDDELIRLAETRLGRRVLFLNAYVSRRQALGGRESEDTLPEKAPRQPSPASSGSSDSP